MKNALAVFAIVRRQPIWLVVILCAVLFSLLSPHFLKLDNLSNLLFGTAIYGIMAIGITFLMINGNIDLSIGSVLALAAAVCIGLEKLGVVAAVGAALLASVVIGGVNGYLVTRVGMNAFIVTLAMMIGVRGLVYVVTNERSAIGSNEGFAAFGSSAVASIPTLAIIFFVLLAASQYVLKHTSHGRNAYAVGGSKDAAKNAGIAVGKHMFVNFLICSLMAGIAGVLLAARMNAASPIFGQNYELMVITAVVLGGTKLNGGFGSMIHSLGGVLAIGILQNGMDLAGVESYYNTLIIGLVLIAVVFVDQKMAAARPQSTP